MRHGLRILAATAALALAAAPAHAMVTISSAATQNMSCASGICAPTAANAVLNVGDLENMLASGNVEITTTGSGVEAKDIVVKAAFGWTSSSALSLDAQKSINVNEPMSVSGVAGLALTTGKNGALSFGPKGNVTFANLSSSLTINGASYTLVNSIKTLSTAIGRNGNGEVALAASYDAGQDGTYTSSPIATTFTGTFEGLGNTISNFSMDDELFDTMDKGFFAELGESGGNTSGLIADFGLTNATITSSVKLVFMGGLAGINWGTMVNAYVSGSVTGTKANSLGGLVGENWGTIAHCHSGVVVTAKNAASGGLAGLSSGPVSDSYATGNVVGGNAGGLIGYSLAEIKNSFATGKVSGGMAGGLVGLSVGDIADSFATGNVRVTGKRGDLGGGGLAGAAGATITDSYATGNVLGKTGADVGGLVGASDAIIGQSYSTGAPTGGTYTGGFIGYDEAAAGSIMNAYWDTDSSGISDPSQGAGNIANDPGITGLTTAQLQSGLPAGFDPAVWAENPNVDGGLPYLIANPPPK